MEGHGGREEFCSPARLALGIQSDWTGHISSVTWVIGSLGHLLPWGKAVISEIFLAPFYFRGTRIILPCVPEIDCVQLRTSLLFPG